MTEQAADRGLIRTRNQGLILDLIRNEKYVTRAALAQSLGLSSPSTCSNVEKMIQRGILMKQGIEAGQNDKLGRRGVLITLNSNYAYLIGVDLSSGVLKVGLSNLAEEILFCEDFMTTEGKDAGNILLGIFQAIDMVLHKYRLDTPQLGAIVICSPGVVDEQSGKMNFVPQYEGWDKLNLRSELETRYHTAVLVKNDINIAALGEAQFGYGTDHDSFIFVNIDLGVGAGIILNHVLYEGTHYAAGEAGYMLSCYSDLQTRQTQGPLEMRIAVPQIRRRLANQLGIDYEKASLGYINDLYQQRNPHVLKEVDYIAKTLSITIINMTALLDVPMVCVGGSITRLRINLEERVRAYIQSLTPYTAEIKFSKLGVNGLLKGAFAIGVKRVFADFVE